MDFKINLPSEECTCDARKFYDKYRKQVDAFIKKELELAEKSLTEIKSTAFEDEKASVISKKPPKKPKVHFPKIRGAKHEGKSDSTFGSSSTTTSHLPKIKIEKTWSDDLFSSTSSLESSMISSLVSSLDAKERLQYKKKIDAAKLSPKKQIIQVGKRKEILKKPIKDEQEYKQTEPGRSKKLKEKGMRKDKKTSSLLSGSITEDTSDSQKIDSKHKRKKQLTDKGKIKMISISSSSSEEKASISSIEYLTKKEIRGKSRIRKSKKKFSKFLQSSEELLLGKKKKYEEFITFLKSKFKKKDLDDDFIESMLAKAKKLGKEDDLLLALSNANTEGTLDALLSSLKKAANEDEIEEMTINLINEGRKKKKSEEIITFLKSKSQKNGLDDDFIESMLAKAKKLGKEDDLLFALSNANKEGTLDALLSSLKKAANEDEIEEMTINLIDEGRKKRKSQEFITFLKTKSKKKGFDDDFIESMLAKAKRLGKEDDLLFALSNANKEGTLDALLFSLKKAADEDEIEEMTTNLIYEGRDQKRKKLLSKLLKNFRSEEKDLEYLADLIAKAREENPDDELILALWKAIEDDNLNSLIETLSEAAEQEQVDNLISVLVEKGEKEQKAQLLSSINAMALEMGENEEFVKNLLARARESGEQEELLSILKEAKLQGNLTNTVSILVDAVKDESETNILSYLPEPEEVQQLREEISNIFFDAGFSDEFLAKWFAETKSKTEENLLIKRLSKISKLGKSAEFSTLIENKDLDINDLLHLMKKVISDNKIHLVYTPIKEQKPKVLQPKVKQVKASKIFRQSKSTKGSFSSKAGKETRTSLYPDRRITRLSKERKTQQKLFKKEYVDDNNLPDVDYDLVERHVIPVKDLEHPEKVEEEEFITVPKPDMKKSRQYRKSFLEKIYGGRKIAPMAPRHESKTDDSTNIIDNIIVKKRATKKIIKFRKKDSVAIKETPLPKKIKKNIIKHTRKVLKGTKEESVDEYFTSSIEDELDEKISKICEISGEERTERGYLVGFRYKDADDDDETFDWKKKSKKSSSSSESIISGEWISRARRRAIIYFNSRKIEELFHFLGSHLVSNKPDDPIEYLIELLGSCLNYRDGIGRPPLLFEDYHVESLYGTMDILNEGFISLEQYKIGMESLFIKEYSENPRTNTENMVTKNTFILEALKRQRIQLKDMLRGTSRVFNEKHSISTLGSIWSKIEVYQNN